MSYEIVKKVLFKEDGVYITSASNNVSPRTFEEFRSDHYSKILHEKGFLEMVKNFSDSAKWYGTRFLKGNKFCNCMLAAQKEIEEHGTLSSFLNRDTYNDYIAASVAAKYQGVPFHDRQDRIDRLLAMRKDPEAVFAMCEGNVEAFFYADDSIQNNPDYCKRYVREFAGELGFNFPMALYNDRESVLIAVSQHGCNLRRMPLVMRGDKEIVLAAFSAKKYPEHLPDTISPDLQNNAEFMEKVIEAQPKIHFDRSPIMMSNPDIVLKLAEKAEWVENFKYIPKNIRNRPDIQKAMASRILDPLSEEQRDRRAEILSAIVFPEYLIDALSCSQDEKTEHRDAFDFTTPQELANALGRPLKDGDRVYMPTVDEEADSRAHKKTPLDQKIKQAEARKPEPIAGEQVVPQELNQQR